MKGIEEEQKNSWVDNINEWKGLSLLERQRETECGGEKDGVNMR